MTADSNPPGGPRRPRRVELHLGDIVGGHRIVGALGRGSVGVVHVGEHLTRGTRAAIKVLRPEVSRSPELVQQFFADARAAATLRHPGIVAVHDFGYTEDELAYVVTELLEGVSLEQHLREVGRMTVPAAVRLVREIAVALAAAHDRGIVHGGLDASSVFLASRGSARPSIKLLDFGVARLRAGLPVPRDPRGDLYSLGCLCFELLAGRPPFIAGSAYELTAAHLAIPPPDLREHAHDVPADLAAMVDRLLAKTPSLRFQSGHELLAALDETIARVESASVSASAAGAPTPPTVPVARARRHALAIAATVLIVAAALALALTRCT